MAFCINCGQELVDGAKFCSNCGTATNNANSTSQRKTVFDGEIHKCPNCGEVLNSFATNCPSCGVELRGAKVTTAVREFALKLEAIEAMREYEKPHGRFKQVAIAQQISKTDEQKISLIKSFSIPNTKEDILEFMILATSNVDMAMYESTDTPTAGVKAMNEAWHSKIRQVYEKAKVSYRSDPDFSRIQELYNSCFSDIAGRKRKKTAKLILQLGWIPLAWVVIIVFLLVSEPREEAKEIARLNAIVADVQEALENDEYKLALSHADSIDYQRYDIEMERKWDIQREYWVEKVLDAASANGVILEYTPSADVDKANNETEDEGSTSGFAAGFKDGLSSGFDEAQENIDEFEKIINDGSVKGD